MTTQALQYLANAALSSGSSSSSHRRQADSGQNSVFVTKSDKHSEKRNLQLPPVMPWVNEKQSQPYEADASVDSPRSPPPQVWTWTRHERAADVPLSVPTSSPKQDATSGGSAPALDALARELSSIAISKNNAVLADLSARLQSCGVFALDDLKGMSREEVSATVVEAQLTPLQFNKLYNACVQRRIP